jgi:hypothetical protein
VLVARKVLKALRVFRVFRALLRRKDYKELWDRKACRVLAQTVLKARKVFRVLDLRVCKARKVFRELKVFRGGKELKVKRELLRVFKVFRV